MKTTVRASSALPPSVTLSSRSSVCGSPGCRRAERRSRPTLRITSATWTTRSGRRSPGHAMRLASAPSVTSHCWLSRRSSAAGGAAGSLCPAPATIVATVASLGAPRLCQGSESRRTSTSDDGSSASCMRTRASPSASRVPVASRVSMLSESSIHSVTRTRSSGSRGPASAIRSSAASSARRRHAGSGGRRSPACGRLASEPRQSARRDTGISRRGGPPRCSQRMTGSRTRPASHSGVRKLSNAIAPARDARAACAATAGPRPSR